MTDYGEPWVSKGNTEIRDREGFAVAMYGRWLDRTIACVNACAGLADPAIIRSIQHRAEAFCNAIKEVEEKP